MMSRHDAGRYLFLVSAACLLAAGCRPTVYVAESQRPLDVKVMETERARIVDAETAVRVKLESRFGRGMALVAAGETAEGLAILRAVQEEAASVGIKLPPQVENDLRRALSGELPRAAGDQAVPASVGTAQPPKVIEPLPKEEPPSERPAPKEQARTPAGREPPGRVHLPALTDPEMADKLISVDFSQVDIRIVLKTISDITGVNFLVDDNIRGTVTLISPTKIRLGEVYKVLESILEVKGYAAVPAGKIVKIIPRVEAAKRNLMTRVGSDPAAIPQEDTVVTQIIPLRFANAGEVSTLIAPLASTGAHVATYPQTNTIMITDTSSNIYHIARIIREFDVPGTQEEMSVIQLKHASAQVLSYQVAQMMEQTQVATTRPRPGRQPRIRQTRTVLKILPDARTNSLIVLASARDTETIKGLVKWLDVERPLEASNIHVVYLEHAAAKELVESLSKAVGKMAKGDAGQKLEPAQITADESTNALIITASPQDFKVIADMIAKLDIVREQVLVEMRILEATDEALTEIGFDWATLTRASAESVRGFGYTNLGPRVESTTGDIEGLAVGVFKDIGGVVRIGAVVKALERHAGVNVLSTPHILTSNHQQATILVGENIPYVKESRITEADPATPTAIKTYDYKDVGIELKITPHISQGGLVRLEIDTIFTKLIEGAAGAGADTPTTAKREAKTVVSIMGGATVVIGGLIRDDKVTTEKAVPFVSDIPLLGRLFKWKRNVVQKTNLLFFITPHVLTNKDDLARMTLRKEAEAQPTGVPKKKK